MWYRQVFYLSRPDFGEEFHNGRNGMERQPIKSSNLKSVGFDSSTDELEVEFHTFSVYVYFNVPESVYNALLSARSKGQYFNDKIRDNYRNKKLK